MVLIRLLNAILPADPLVRKVLLWSLMSAVVFWVLVYRRDTEGARVPEFVYVNF